ncbi:MAG: mechanosensitive ion channel [Thermodesulfobacteriota bacterium]
METIKQLLAPLLDALGRYLPSVFGALLIFLVGIGAAKLIRKAIVAFCEKMNVDERLAGKVGEEVHIARFLGSLAYYLVALWVLLLTLDVLGVKDVLDPVMLMFSNFLGIFPNLVAALLIAFTGYFIAKILASSVEVLARGLDGFSSRVGLSEQFRISRLIGQLVFLVIFIPVLISALDALKIEAISIPSTQMLTTILSAIPKILAAVLILGVAFIVGRFVTSAATELLQNLGADRLPEKLGFKVVMGDTTSFSRVCGGLLFFFVMLAATVSAVEQLAMPQLASILGEFLVFAGQIVLGLVILAIGNFIATLAFNALSQTADNRGLATIARVAILALVLAMGLRAMGIADDIVDLAFGLTLGAVAIAFALAFGLGGREAAGRQMEYWLKNLRKEE